MPSMDEVYRKHADEYHRLVSAEDCENNLARHLLRLTEWRGKSVLEAGVGTGRVTLVYARHAAAVTCIDRSSHMLEAASDHLRTFGEKMKFVQADNLSLPDLGLAADIFIEGWSWGHSIVDSHEPVASVFERLLEGVRKNVAEDAAIILIETMGTNVVSAAPPRGRLAELYELLESRYGMQRTILRTDYSFQSAREAAEVMGFFFGPEMEKRVADRRSKSVPEWTGVWSANMPM